jgi:hypothetical protein
MWIELDPTSASLEQVFHPLAKKAGEFTRPWSIAELRLCTEDVRRLRAWFENLTPSIAER